ncbi:MAG: hypothetical protein H6738_12105 [Alphaproteobacteria bacterium]|nr:hypothetical protein [Alphaproteobacteria bacterium]MCB9697515.1 hypothetical protein [Alphaproteobacteria bacterium]
MWWALAVAAAHPGADERMDARLHELSACEPGLWLERARALADERRTDEALEAVGRAEACGASPVELALSRGLLLAGPRPADALVQLDAVLKVLPDHAGALAARAHARADLGMTADAIGDLRRAIATSRAPSPDDVLLVATLLERQGDPEAALAALDDSGLTAPAVVDRAVALELALGRPESALGRLDAMPDTPTWWERRAEIEGW